MTRVSSILFWSGLTLVVSLALYGTSNRVQDMNKQLRKLNAQIEAEQANIHVLKAEWVYLANPERIEAAARKYLAMHPTAIKQIAKLDNLPEILPTAKEAKINETANGKIAGIANNGRIPQPEPESKRVAAAEPLPISAAQGGQAYVNTHMHLQTPQDHEMRAYDEMSRPEEIAMAESAALKNGAAP